MLVNRSVNMRVLMSKKSLHRIIGFHIRVVSIKFLRVDLIGMN
jgi:hypothetical protein